MTKQELKAEAVKRWKEFHSAMDYYDNEGNNHDLARKYEGMMQELEEFFNLTKEDLK